MSRVMKKVLILYLPLVYRMYNVTTWLLLIYSGTLICHRIIRVSGVGVYYYNNIYTREATIVVVRNRNRGA